MNPVRSITQPERRTKKAPGPCAGEGSRLGLGALLWRSEPQISWNILEWFTVFQNWHDGLGLHLFGCWCPVLKTEHFRMISMFHFAVAWLCIPIFLSFSTPYDMMHQWCFFSCIDCIGVFGVDSLCPEELSSQTDERTRLVQCDHPHGAALGPYPAAALWRLRPGEDAGRTQRRGPALAPPLGLQVNSVKDCQSVVNKCPIWDISLKYLEHFLIRNLRPLDYTNTS